MKSRTRTALGWIVAVLGMCGGCGDPRVAPVMPPGVEAPRLAPPTAGGTPAAIGETAAVGGSAPEVSKIVSEPTPVGQEKKIASGLVYTTEREGNGPQILPGQTATLKYVGRLEDGSKFYDTADHGGTEDVVVGMGRNIQGLDEGVPGMKVGEKRKLVIPGHMGYGAEGQKGIIPPNANLVIDVELVGVK